MSAAANLCLGGLRGGARHQRSWAESVLDDRPPLVRARWPHRVSVEARRLHRLDSPGRASRARSQHAGSRCSERCARRECQRRAQSLRDALQAPKKTWRSATSAARWRSPRPDLALGA